MKKLLLSATLFTLLAAPALAQTNSIEIKVAAKPSSPADIVEAHQTVLEAAKELCSRENFRREFPVTREAAEQRCVKATYEAAVARGRDLNLAVFQADSAPAATNFE